MGTTETQMFQFPSTARRFISASTASTLCTFTNAATLACRTSRIKSGSLTANSLNVSSISSGRISRRIAFCISGRWARLSTSDVSVCRDACRSSRNSSAERSVRLVLTSLSPLRQSTPEQSQQSCRYVPLVTPDTVQSE